MTGRGGVPRAAEWIAENDTLVSRRGHRIAFRRRGEGPTLPLLHGFPTWSYDYAEVASDLARDHEVITLDFLGYGASDKPNPYQYSVAESADIVEDLAAHLGVKSMRLVIHDYGGIVGQELVDRANRGQLGFAIDSIFMLNCGRRSGRRHSTSCPSCSSCWATGSTQSSNRSRSWRRRRACPGWNRLVLISLLWQAVSGAEQPPWTAPMPSPTNSCRRSTPMDRR
jgi:pimeloyl-ACP methyl ester carboxylesterase